MAIIITGAASGIGYATAQEFIKNPIDDRGIRLALVDRDGDGLAKAQRELAAPGIEIETIVADLSDLNCGHTVIDQTLSRFGSISVLISNAGAIHAGTLNELDVKDFDFLMSVNLRATFLLAQAAYPHLSATKGALVATASTAAEQPIAGLGAYSCSKAALLMMVRQMAAEWGPAGIRCNCVSPGPTHTAMTSASYDDPETRAKRGAEIPLGRVGTPTDLAQAIRFLAGPAASHISGVNLRVDGGLNAMAGNSTNSAAKKIE